MQDECQETNMTCMYYWKCITSFEKMIGEGNLLAGHLIYWLLSLRKALVTLSKILVTELNVTLNLSATSRVTSWFVMHHRYIITCFFGSIDFLPKRLPTGMFPVATISLTKASHVPFVIRKCPLNSSIEYEGNVCVKKPSTLFRLCLINGIMPVKRSVLSSFPNSI